MEGYKIRHPVLRCFVVLLLLAVVAVAIGIVIAALYGIGSLAMPLWIDAPTGPFPFWVVLAWGFVTAAFVAFVALVIVPLLVKDIELVLQALI